MQKRNNPFVCENCSQKVPPAGSGKCRNHCPNCLYSKHVDISPGDRKHSCKGLMKPVRLEKRKDSLYIQHRCLKCGMLKWNKVLKDDKINFDKIKINKE